MKGIPWNARLDASVDPVLTVIAEGWYEARAIAAAQLNVDLHRIHVEQCRGGLVGRARRRAQLRED